LSVAPENTEMAWFRNHYVCLACEGHWLAERSAAIEDDCPFCRAYDVAPYKSDDRTLIVEPAGETFVVLECAGVKTQAPVYRAVGSFASRAAARAFMAER
jgi:hypothetical protein